MKSIFSKIALASSGIFLGIGFLAENVKAATLENSGNIKGNTSELLLTITQPSLIFFNPSTLNLEVSPANQISFPFWRPHLIWITQEPNLRNAKPL